jgi:protein-tyrosine-phosphatase
MEEYHHDYLVRSWPESEHKIEMLGQYITPDQPDDEIIDPYCRSPYHYRLVQSQIMLAVSNLLKTISD